MRCIYIVDTTNMAHLVKKWGNSAAVLIPAAVPAQAGLDIDQPVDIRQERGRIIIEAMRNIRFERDDLLAQITPENRHDPVETGPAVGREIW